MGMVKHEREIRQWYERFVESFHRNDIVFMENINLKYDHTERVVIETRGIAVSLNLSAHDLTLVMIAAMLHDVGRYPQLKEYGTFNDSKSVNHSLLGSNLLRENDVLEKLIPEERELILSTIEHHSAIEIPTKLPEKSRLFIQILRDADKLDIWRILSAHYTHTERERNNSIDFDLPDGDSVNVEILESLEKREVVHVKNIENRTELKLIQLAWVYDLNFPWTFQLVHNRNFLPDIISTLPKTPAISECTSAVLDYLETQAKAAKESGLRGR